MTTVARYLLDTSALIDLSRSREPGRSDVQALIDAGEELGVCGVVVAEFFSGLPPPQRSSAEAFLETLRFWAATREIAIRAGGYRYVYARQGHAISAPDALIAATAVSVGAILVTHNVRHFPMPELTVMRPGT